ncbi:MAG: HNH endonuclease [Prolixibacteraceae bacterium]|nr:HNH endonuclease [Prolixibacteraceae bacterium]
MGIMNKKADQAFFENGVFESVLEEIIASQKIDPTRTFYLQPNAEKIIRGLNDYTPGGDNKCVFYASTTKDLAHARYTAELIGWENKQELTSQRMAELEEHISQFQPKEEGIYLESSGKKCVNLISIKNLRKLAHPIPVNRLFKISDGTALKPRTQAGGWSYVYPLPSGDSGDYILKSVLENELAVDVKTSLSSSNEARNSRLESAPRYPEKIIVVSTGFRRNSDVIAEVLTRANGKCELCHGDAPFLKASDETPYLEVHHWTPLAENGEDTVANAAALCPNCHKQAHFGQNKEYIKDSRRLT